MSKRNFRVAVCAILACLVSAAPAAAASGNQSTTTGRAAATVIKPIRLIYVAGHVLSFGKFTTGTGGTVVVNIWAPPAVTGQVTFTPDSVTSNDEFSVYGDPFRSFSIYTGSGRVLNGAKFMNFVTFPSTSWRPLDNNGKSSFLVGGILTVAGNETPGSYIGTYNATVTYN